MAKNAKRYSSVKSTNAKEIAIRESVILVRKNIWLPATVVRIKTSLIVELSPTPAHKFAISYLTVVSINAKTNVILDLAIHVGRLRSYRKHVPVANMKSKC